ncbi:competence protein ComE [Staphylococcus schweitzeri]|uniref:Competence protein ComE n=1 Tax=Staphylococcus schweitzeri TaxID=1654388 RepID=A0A2K4AGY7_9STAP|nr:helix-hairpin-helix domain-containing protein [Staphylococcus schweitzeri]PNZ49208.1 competence protein ComE [Staphylococcus schweitzeri]
MVLLYQFLLRYKNFFNQWKVYIISAIVSFVLLAGFIFWRQDHQLQNNKVNNNDASFKQLNTDNNDIKLVEGQNKDGDKRTKNKGPVYVDVKGAIKHPNVYKMSSVDRVIDLLNKAELLEDADVSQINLSEKLTDQKMIYIPRKGQKNVESQLGTNKSQVGQSNTNVKVNLNTASASELMSVPGVGQTKANAIIEHRNQQGAFQDIEELKKVKGFGSKTFEKLKSYFAI